MANILLLSSSEEFFTDLKEQINLNAADFAVYGEKKDDVVFDVAIVDEDWKQTVLLQKKLRKTPIIYLGNNADENVSAITTVSKPLRLEALLDLILSSANLFAHSNDGQLQFGGYVLNSGKKDIVYEKSGKSVKLTEREVAILNYLYKTHEKNVTKNELLSEVWGYNPDATTHTVETHIYRLRQKIEDGTGGCQVILTEENGYKLNF